MDLFSVAHIASNAAGVAQTAWKIYEFINNAKNVDSTIRALKNEMKQIREVLGLVKEQAKLLPEGSDLLKAIQGQINACAIPLATIDSKLKPGKQSNIFKQAFRQTKLSLNEDEIKTCQKQIQTSITNLQLSLQLVNLQATYIATQRADDILLPCLENIQRTLDAQGQRISEPIRRCATTYLSNGSILYERSVRGESVVGSESNSQSGTVSDWLNHMADLKVSGVTIDSVSQDATLMSPSRSVSPGLCETVRGHGSGDSLNTQVINASLELGKKAFYAKDFDKAGGFLGESLELIRPLSVDKQGGYNLEELNLLHAICTFYTQDSTSAEAALGAVVRTTLGTPENAEMKCEASRCLAVVHTRMEKFDLATSICETIYQDQVKLFGKDERCFKTIALLAYIYDRQGKSVRADTYRSLVPANVRDQYFKDAKESSLTEDPRFNKPKLPPFQAEHPNGPRFNKPELPPFQANHPDGPHLTLEHIVWSPDNRYVAISRGSNYEIISLRCAMTGKSSYEWKLDGQASCLAFDRMSSKLAVAFWKQDRAIVEVFETQSWRQIHSISYIGDRFGNILSLTFDHTTNRLLVLFGRYHYAEPGGKAGYNYAVTDVDTGKQLHFGRTNGQVRNVAWTNDYIAFTSDTYIQFLNATSYVEGHCRHSLEPILDAGMSPSGALMIIQNDGAMLSYQGEESLSYSEGFVLKGKLICAVMAFNSYKSPVIIAATESCNLYLGAPLTKKWTSLGKRGSWPNLRRIGLSPDAEYAFWVGKDKGSNYWMIHKWRVEDHLQFKDGIPKTGIAEPAYRQGALQAT